MLERTNDVGHTLASSYRSGLQTSVSKPSFSTQEIEQAKASHDLVSLIGARVKLTREGQEWRGLCPFHNENTPSFSVVPLKGFYHCFGCGAHGDALTWLMHTQSISFRQAVETSLQRPVTRPVGQHKVIHMTQPQGNRLAIAEGIETALSIMQACPDYGVWSAMSLGNMKAPVPKSVTEIVLCADGDNKDPRMADRILREAADEHIARGHTVLIAHPPQGMDFNDLLTAG